MRPWIRMCPLIIALALVQSPAFADESASLEELVVEMADTPADHAAVAAHYRAKAAEARASARRHASMGRVYGGGKMNNRIQMRGHCDRLKTQYEAIAAEYDALAKEHDELAKAAP